MVKKNVLIMTGDDTPYHNARNAGSILEDIIAGEGHRTTRSDSLEMFLPENIRNFDVIVFYMNRREISAEQEGGLLDAVSGASGEVTGKPKGFIGLHLASCSFPESSKYIKMLGARIITHPPMDRELLIKVRSTGSPVVRGIKDFRITDELYMMDLFPPFHTLLSCRYEDFDFPLAWAKPYGMGRVFYNALGHDREQLNHPAYQKILLNAVDWTA